MDYNHFLFAHLFEANIGNFGLDYDELFEIVKAEYDMFLESPDNDKNYGLYTCIDVYLSHRKYEIEDLINERLKNKLI